MKRLIRSFNSRDSHRNSVRVGDTVGAERRGLWGLGTVLPSGPLPCACHRLPRAPISAPHSGGRAERSHPRRSSFSQNSPPNSPQTTAGTCEAQSTGPWIGSGSPCYSRSAPICVKVRLWFVFYSQLDSLEALRGVLPETKCGLESDGKF